MQKLVEFGISESSNNERLCPSQELVDLVNGTGEYLGMIQLGDHEIMITRTISSGKGQYNGQIMANEVEYDTYSDGSIAIYYNMGKSDELVTLQQHLNHPIIERVLSQGKGIKDALYEVGVDVERYTTNMEERIISEFTPSERSIFPPDYDFDESERMGYTDKDKDIKKVPIEHIMVTGIQPELFENLRQAKKYTHMTTYQMAAFLKQMEEDKQKGR